MALLYCFMGVAIIADIFMGAIEKITSTTRKVLFFVSFVIIVYLFRAVPSRENSASDRIYGVIPW